jgi:glycosyltransferase involved in cell wall biosynthesis
MASVVEALGWSARASRLVRTYHAVRPFDVAHAHFIMPAGIVAASLKRHAQVPFVITAHGSDVPGYNRERLKLAHVVARPWWRRICHAADGFISPSHSLLQAIERHVTLGNPRVIPNGFWPDRFEPEGKEKRILLCSRLVERKGFHHFLEAISDLDLDGWQVDLVGDGPLFGRLSQMAARSRTPVIMHGWINNDDARLAELYAKARIFVFPSEHENCAIALLEGMGAGCALISTTIPAITSVVGDDGVLVPPNDPQALRQAVLRLTADAAECERLGERARKRALADFSWSSVGSQCLRYLEEHLTARVPTERVLCACA